MEAVNFYEFQIFTTFLIDLTFLSNSLKEVLEKRRLKYTFML